MLFPAVVLASAGYAPLLSPVRLASRHAVPVMMPEPFKSDANFDYFRVSRQVSVTLTKPLGAVLEESPPSGVRVEELPGGRLGSRDRSAAQGRQASQRAEPGCQDGLF